MELSSSREGEQLEQLLLLRIIALNSVKKASPTGDQRNHHCHHHHPKPPVYATSCYMGRGPPLSRRRRSLFIIIYYNYLSSKSDPVLVHSVLRTLWLQLAAIHMSCSLLIAVTLSSVDTTHFSSLISPYSYNR